MGRFVRVSCALAASLVLLVGACTPSELPNLSVVPTSTPDVMTPTLLPSPTDATPGRSRQERNRSSTPAPYAPTPTTRDSVTGTSGGDDHVLVGAGDIATCSNDGDEETARLLDSIDGTVFTLGDNAYDEGTGGQFEECYGPTWGRHKSRTRPAAGNHEYRSENASPYFDYFGEAAGEEGKGYYSYDLGAWHIVVLNSNCSYIGGCGAGSAQGRWLRADLAAHPATCTLAYWHHPLFSSGRYEGIEAVEPLWEALYEAGAEIVLAGHDHNYQRYAPQDPGGALDPERGIRQFVVGTGGRSHYEIEEPDPNLEIYNDDTEGVLKLALGAGGYSWEFVPVRGSSFLDSGKGTCH